MYTRHTCDLDAVIRNGYCIGCGLCVAVTGPDKLKMVESDSGFLVPENISGGKLRYDRSMCPGITLKQKLKKKGSEKIYGPYRRLAAGHATDPTVRYKASSGGLITALLCFLFDHSLIDGVLHVGKDLTNPLRSQAYYSVLRQDIVDRSGSRYGPSCLLSNFPQVLMTGSRVAVVGKPCDIAALRLFLEKYPHYKNQVVIALSFMCMGIPSIHATYSLVRKMGCKSDDVADFWYRGNGWPGKATLIDNSSKRHACSYDESWGQILGRNLHFRCKICPDGYGEFADISCGDAWHSKDGKPSFDEADGRSLIFVRTSIGQTIYDDAVAHKCITVEDFDVEQLRFIQPAQFYRKRTVGARIAALKVLGDSLLKVQGFDFLPNLWQAGARSALGNVLGTLRRRT